MEKWEAQIRAYEVGINRKFFPEIDCGVIASMAPPPPRGRLYQTVASANREKE